ncbi:MAG: hypothetical protein JJE52_09720 [Acidimicrobiia bacterium]|nr:hypothetical protein [Acidimicrobiia bacterium]
MDHAPVTPPRTWIGPVVAVAVRPQLWTTATAVVLRLARPGWWRRGRRLPLPDRNYWHFRSLTAFGVDGGVPSGPEVVAYLEWCRAWPRVAG